MIFFLLNLNSLNQQSFDFGKKISSDTKTEIGPWFRFPIPKPGFGFTLTHGQNADVKLCLGVLS